MAKSWDNTGLLVDASNDEPTDKNEQIRVLLTIDLTQDVATEAIENKSNFIMAYHPFIFKGLKSIRQSDPQQRTLIELIRNGISVHSPHTAVDSAKGGVDDFLADGITKGLKEYWRAPIEKSKNKKEEGCGMGRIIHLLGATHLSTVVKNVKETLGLSHLQVALGRGEDKDPFVGTIAISAGSGGDLLRGVRAHLYITGELSHHEALYFNETGASVIVCNHSNTERAFLPTIQKQLISELPEGSEVKISEKDKEPFQIW